MKRTELRRRTPLARSSKPLPNRRPGRPTTDPDKATRDAVKARTNGRCSMCGDPTATNVHHRLKRSQGGDNRLSNLILVCGSGTSGCHGWIHGRVTEAGEHGLLLKPWQKPELEPLLSQGGSCWLRNDGTVAFEPPEDYEPPAGAEPEPLGPVRDYGPDWDVELQKPMSDMVRSALAIDGTVSLEPPQEEQP